MPRFQKLPEKKLISAVLTARIHHKALNSAGRRYAKPMKFQDLLIGIGLFLLTPVIVKAQFTDEDIKVYGIDDGLSHRNIFKIDQDAFGFIWIATINGLNRFDGSNFISFSNQNSSFYIPHNTISDMLISQDGKIRLANPDFITTLQIEEANWETFKIKEGDIVRRESLVPNNLFRDSLDRLWMSAYDETSGQSSILTLSNDTSLRGGPGRTWLIPQATDPATGPALLRGGIRK